MEWDISYRKGNVGEIEATVTADTEELAVKKFLNGEVKTATINYSALWGDFVEATPHEG